MKFVLLLSIPALTLAVAYENPSSALLMSQVSAKTASITEYMADKINEHSLDIQKRGFIGNLKQNLRNYIDETYTQKSLKSFEPVMKKEVDNAFRQYDRHTKRDIILTQEQERYRQHAFSEWLSKRLESKLKNHMLFEFQEWKDDHINFKTRAEALFQNKAASIQKRYIERTPKKMAIFGIVTAFLLIPIFINPFTIGFYGILLTIISFLLFFDPILKRVTFGEWF